MTNIDAALHYARAGIAIFPIYEPVDINTCSCGNPECSSVGKHPRTSTGYKAATTNEEIIINWWKMWPNASIGIITGERNKIIVLDIDPRSNGIEELLLLESEYGKLPETLKVNSGRNDGGYHLYFRYDLGNLEETTNRFADGIDIKNNGYVVAPPSLHAATMLPYEWVNYGDQIATLPAWARNKILKQTLPDRTPNKNGTSITDTYNLRAEDYIIKNAKREPGRLRGTNAVHGSTSGTNTTVDLSRNIWCCHRCGSGGDGAIAYAVAKGIIQCHEARAGILSDKTIMSRVLSALEADGLKDPQIKHTDMIKMITPEELPDIPMKHIPVLNYNLDETNFISQYIKYWHTRTDAYQEYHHMAATCLLSIAVNRKILIPLTFDDIRPNIWCIALGKSGISRKSTAVNKIKTFANKAFPDHLLPNAFTMESLIELLSSTPRAHMVADECAGLLQGFNKKQYLADVRDVLCQMYDGQDIRRKLRTSQRKNGETDFRVDAPYLTFAWATTYEGFQMSATTLDVMSGLLNRFLIYAPNYKKSRLGASIATIDVRAGLDDLMARYLQIVQTINLFGSILMYPSERAIRMYNEWEEKEEIKILAEETDAKGSIMARMGPTIFKLSVLYYIGSDEFKMDAHEKYALLNPGGEAFDVEGVQMDLYKIEMSIPDKFFEEALANVIEYFYPVASSALQMVNNATDQNVQETILRFLRDRNGRATRSDVIKRARVKSKDLHEHLSTLEEGGSIRIDLVRTDESKRPIEYITLLE